ncbi:hypothetical protein M3Y99_00526500 [Aphelenchoides fujianensis]|nr:hypothetical protein M3Y99_00526500 [Aphelenchoides fujianensis]
MAVVKPKPRMGAAVRDGVNRHLLLAAKAADERKTATQLLRWAAISRTHLAAFRSAARGIKIDEIEDGRSSLKLEFGPTCAAIEFAVARAEINAIVRLLRAPAHGLKDENAPDSPADEMADKDESPSEDDEGSDFDEYSLDSNAESEEDDEDDAPFFWWLLPSFLLFV